LTINTTKRFEGHVPRQPRDRPPRQERIDELLGIMLRWDPRERVGAFKAWLRGSLSLVHLHVLTTLETEGPLPMNRLADALDVSVASATGIVDRMEQRGLVERRRSTSDRRVVQVHVTDPGADVFKTIDEHRRAQVTAILERLTDNELASLLVGLRATRAASAAMTAEAAARGGADG
jgi:DNA-binding MarR family transcriptional regulator